MAFVRSQVHRFGDFGHVGKMWKVAGRAHAAYDVSVAELRVRPCLRRALGCLDGARGEDVCRVPGAAHDQAMLREQRCQIQTVLHAP